MNTMKMMLGTERAIAALCAAAVAGNVCGGPLDTAWIRGTTDRSPIAYRPGEKMTFTLAPQNVGADLPQGAYFLTWTRSGDDGIRENGKVPFDGKPFVYSTKIDRPGFVRLQARVVDKDGRDYRKKFLGDPSTPEGRKALDAFNRRPKSVFFDGGAGVDLAKLATEKEPADFDAFWTKQYARLDKVPIRADTIEIPCANPKSRLYAVRIDCAGLRPVTGYLSIPKAVDAGKKFPARLTTHGYSGDRCTHETPKSAGEHEIALDINAHGLKLVEFGATEADTKALRWETRSHDCSYAFDVKQNADPEVAYFNGMVLRVKRALQYLKTLKGWNGKDLIASGGSQGGLQTIWAAACGEGVTRADSGITWCCDMYTNGKLRKDPSLNLAADGWYIPWTDALGYYDAAIFAKRIPTSCRTCITRAGLGDYCCPPTGLAKLYNNIPGNKVIHWMQGSQHGWPPPPYEGRDFVVKSEDGGGIRHAAKRRRATGTWVVEAGIRKFKLGRSGGEAIAEAKAAETRPVTNATVYVDESVSLDELNARTFLPGTKVLFRRGGVWRGFLVPRSGRKGYPIVYGAYGEGPKPIIEPSYACNRADDWCEIEAEKKGAGEEGRHGRIWKTEPGAVADIGNIVFEDGAKGCAFKRGSLAELKNDLDFWCDPKTFDVYLKSAGNPVTRFKSIELCEKVHCIDEGKMHDVVYDGLHLRYTAAHGIGGDGVRRITVRNCDIDWIGGGYLYYDNAGRGVRYGNGIEFWANCEDVLVESNRVSECWDAALTNQSSMDGAVQKNVVWRGNEVWNCEYSYEYWQQGNNARTENVVLEGNRFRDAGCGWGHRQRWNPNAAHLMFYDTTAETRGFFVRNNVFSRSADTLFRLFNDWRDALTFSDNAWIAETESLCRFHGRPTANLTYRYPDHLDQIHDDNRAEIESQTVTPPRVFRANEKKAFLDFLVRRSNRQ